MNVGTSLPFLHASISSNFKGENKYLDTRAYKTLKPRSSWILMIRIVNVLLYNSSYQRKKVKKTQKQIRYMKIYSLKMHFLWCFSPNCQKHLSQSTATFVLVDRGKFLGDDILGWSTTEAKSMFELDILGWSINNQNWYVTLESASTQC